MTWESKNNAGRVCLVGAGPGDPRLITIAGLERLQQADVVVVDALVWRRLLDHVPAYAQVIDVGKRAGQHTMNQQQINEVLLEQALADRMVVRLKGGDPYLFGRGAEEASYLARHGICVEVIPGVTAGIAAPATAGIAVTHRHMASSVIFVTGHEDPTKSTSLVCYNSLAKLVEVGGTACFYMAMARLESVCAALVGGGLNDQTPAAVIQWGTLPQQRHVCGTLATIGDLVQCTGLGAPAIVVIGAVAGIEDPGLSFFSSRPLFGRCIINTRSRQQVSVLTQNLETLGAVVLEAPTLEIVRPVDDAVIDKALSMIETVDWLILTSVNGVAALAERVDAGGADARSFAKVKIAAIGSATAKALRQQLGLRADLVPREFEAEALAQQMIVEHAMAGCRVLLLRADIARPVLADRLTAAGAKVSDLAIYCTQPSPGLPEPVLEALRKRTVDWVTFTSSSTVTNLIGLLGEDHKLLHHTKLACIGPITSQSARDHGLQITVEAQQHTIDGLVEAIAAWHGSG